MSDEPIEANRIDLQTLVEVPGWHVSWSPENVIDRWGEFVSKIETGYSMSIDDYTNDLCVRQWVYQAEPLLSQIDAREMDRRLTPIDERFREATIALETHLPGTPDEWWAKRAPKIQVGELADDLERILGRS